MSKLHCIICDKHRKFKNPKTPYILKKTLVLAIICSKYKNEDKKLFKEEESIEVLTILGLIESRKKKHDKIASLVKSKLNRIDF